MNTSKYAYIQDQLLHHDVANVNYSDFICMQLILFSAYMNHLNNNLEIFDYRLCVAE